MVGGLASKRRSATPAGGRAALSRGAGPRYCRNTRQIPLKMPAPVPLPRGGPAPAYAASGAMPDLTPRARGAHGSAAPTTGGRAWPTRTPKREVQRPAPVFRHRPACQIPL